MSNASPETEASAPSPVTLELAGAGVTLRADTWGSPEAAPVVLLHGGGQTRHSWSGTARALARDGWYAIALDMRGHGESDWSPDGEYGLERFREDLCCVLSSLERKAAVVGASLGGMTALLTEGTATEPMTAALVLVDIAPRIEPNGVQRIVQFMTGRPEGFETLEDAARAIAAYNPHRPPPKDLSGLAKNLRRGEDGRWRWHWDPRFMSLGVDGSRPSRNPVQLEEAARRVTVPTLLVRGRQSDLLSEEGARAFLEQVPHARYADVSGAGHMVVGDRNDAFSQAVLDFLRDALGDAGRDPD